VADEPILQTLAVSTGLWNLFDNARIAVLVLLLARELHLSAGAIGLVFAVGGIGFVLSTLFPARAARRFGLGRAIVGGIIGVIPGGLLIAAAGGSAPVGGGLVAAGLFLEGLAVPIYDVNQFNLRQAVTPDHLRGRVNASVRVLIRGTLPLGALIGGTLAGAIRVRAVLLLAACGPVVALGIIWRSPVRTLREPPEPAAIAT